MKIFRTGRSPVVVRECKLNFNFLPIEWQLEIRTATLIRKRKAMFLHKLVNLHNELCELFSLVAQAEIDMISFT